MIELPNNKHLVDALYNMAGWALACGRDKKKFVDPEFFTREQWDIFARELRSYLEQLAAGDAITVEMIKTKVREVICESNKEIFRDDVWRSFAEALAARVVGALAPFVRRTQAQPTLTECPEPGDLVEFLSRRDADWELCEVVEVAQDAFDAGNWSIRARFLSTGTDVVVTSKMSCLRRTSVKKCIVEHCANRSDQGQFRGGVCLPCANYLAGRGDRTNSSQAFRNHVAFARKLFVGVSEQAFDQLINRGKL